MSRDQLDALVKFVHSPSKAREVELYKAFGFDPGRQKCTGCYGRGTIRPEHWELFALTRICSKCHGSGWINN